MSLKASLLVLKSAAAGPINWANKRGKSPRLPFTCRKSPSVYGCQQERVRPSGPDGDVGSVSKGVFERSPATCCLQSRFPVFKGACRKHTLSLQSLNLRDESYVPKRGGPRSLPLRLGIQLRANTDSWETGERHSGL